MTTKEREQQLAALRKWGQVMTRKEREQQLEALRKAVINTSASLKESNMLIGDEPQAGYYATRLVPKGPFVAVLIWQAPTGWMVEIDGKISGAVMSVWPMCAKHPISPGEYQYLKRRRSAGLFNADHPAANPYKRVNLRKIPPVKP